MHRTVFRTLAQWLAFPLLIPGLSIFATLAFAASDGSDAAAGRMVSFVSFVGMLLVVGLERALPFRRGWNRDAGDTRTDLLHT